MVSHGILTIISLYRQDSRGDLSGERSPGLLSSSRVSYCGPEIRAVTPVCKQQVVPRREAV